jgi:hypothetical protein
LTWLQERDEPVENSDDEGEDLMEGAERDYMPVPELDTYEEDQVPQKKTRKSHAYMNFQKQQVFREKHQTDP